MHKPAPPKTTSGPDARDLGRLAKSLSTSQIFRDYEEAFHGTAHLPLALQAPQSASLAHHGDVDENPFCALMAKHHPACATCLEAQAAATGQVRAETQTIRCFAGLCETSIPIRAGNELIALLRTGQAGIGQPTGRKFSRIAKHLVTWGLEANLKQFEDAYFHGKFLTREKYAALIRLLTVFAQHLSLLCNQLIIRPQTEESYMVRQAKAFVEVGHQKSFSMPEVAALVNASSFHFCKVFRRETGLRFTEYVSRVRVEKAKSLLLNPHIRVSEAAYQVGFKSTGHFTREFRRYAGRSPREYQDRNPLLPNDDQSPSRLPGPKAT